jgi:hypothetical protein
MILKQVLTTGSFSSGAETAVPRAFLAGDGNEIADAAVTLPTPDVTSFVDAAVDFESNFSNFSILTLKRVGLTSTIVSSSDFTA